MTFEKWRNSEAYQLMNRIYFRPANWIWADNMTDEEKVAHPEYATTGGYLKPTDLNNWCQKWWDSLTYEEKTVIKNIPNFDANIFFEITGINVNS